MAAYGYDLLDLKILRACHSLCQVCSADYQSCSTCKSGNRMKSTDVPPKVCESDQLQGYGWSSLNTSLMVPCGFKCTSCLLNYLECNSCESGFLLKPDETDKSRCYEQANFPLYGPSADGKSLLPCPADCNSCSSLNTKCEICSAGRFAIKWSDSSTDCQTLSAGYRYDSSSLSFK